jgi:hypothetical protein
MPWSDWGGSSGKQTATKTSASKPQQAASEVVSRLGDPDGCGMDDCALEKIKTRQE